MDYYKIAYKKMEVIPDDLLGTDGIFLKCFCREKLEEKNGDL
jgi:hypothetical protein